MFESFTWKLRATLSGNYSHPLKSHIIHLGQFLTPPTNVTIPTTPFKYLKGLHGNCVRHCWETMPAMSAMPAMLVMPGSASAHQLAAPTHHPRTQPTPATQPAPHSTPERSPPQERSTPRTLPAPNAEIAPASSHGDRGRGRGRLSRRARAYSLTPPAVRPETMYFCRYWKSRMTGMAARTAPAAKMPHGAVRSSAAHMYMPTASVNWL